MENKLEQIKDFLKERNIPILRFADEINPTTSTAWLKYVALGSVKVNERIRHENISEFEEKFRAFMKQCSFDINQPVLLSIDGFPSPWVQVDLSQTPSIIKVLSAIPNEPSFILASESQRMMVAVDTEEWDYLLMGARWMDDGRIVSIEL